MMWNALLQLRYKNLQVQFDSGPNAQNRKTGHPHLVTEVNEFP
ncbi:hypothetical protein J2Y68_003507 [Paenarthrobacter nitroguajacolicus]|nr:hypothetical protein [Paenarthrobacter nitroguajacolicus]